MLQLQIVLHFILLLFWQDVTAFLQKTELETDFIYENPIADNLEQHNLSPNGYEFEMRDLLGLGDRPMRMKRHPSLESSASKFLMEVYNELNEEEEKLPLHTLHYNSAASRYRNKRALRDDHFITELDRLEIEKCNNIITFASKFGKHEKENNTGATLNADNLPAKMSLFFNTNDVPKDLHLVHATLRIYQNPSIGIYAMAPNENLTISLYQRMYNRQYHKHEYRIYASLNSTTLYQGWLEFNVTRLLQRWLSYRSMQQAAQGNEIRVGVSLNAKTAINPLHVGLIEASNEVSAADLLEQQPFMIGYFDGPELMVKIQKLRFKRDIVRRKRRADFYNMPADGNNFAAQEIYRIPKMCERMNFTLDFKELNMHNWVIAPKKFEAYFCGGECNFPLSSKMNATNHAIVQTLMHLKQPNLPKPCCVPTVLGSISILHYLNEDSVNLSKYPQSVAKECGCH